MGSGLDTNEFEVIFDVIGEPGTLSDVIMRYDWNTGLKGMHWPQDCYQTVSFRFEAQPRDYSPIYPGGLSFQTRSIRF